MTMAYTLLFAWQAASVAAVALTVAAVGQLLRVAVRTVRR